MRILNIRRLAWVAVALVVVFVLVLSLREHGETDTAPSAPAASAEPAQGDAEAPAAVASAGERGTGAPPPAVACSEQQFDLTLEGKTISVCVGPVKTGQSGSVRTYSVDSTSEPSRWLRIEVADRAVLSAALGSGRVADFQCRGQDCGGITLGKRDVEGARMISIHRVALKRAQADGASPATALINGKLTTVPEDRLPGLACTGEGVVSVVTSEGASHSFCAKGGAGFEVTSGGNRTYRFTSLESDSILILVDPGRQVKQVELQGDSTLSCVGPSCGVRFSEPNGAGERTFTFAGTTLVEKSTGQMNAVLNGTLIVPPLE